MTEVFEPQILKVMFLGENAIRIVDLHTLLINRYCRCHSITNEAFKVIKQNSYLIFIVYLITMSIAELRFFLLPQMSGAVS
jgi:hypothetical protein